MYTLYIYIYIYRYIYIYLYIYINKNFVHQVGNQPRLYYDAGQPIIKIITVFWNVTLWSLVELHRRFGETRCMTIHIFVCFRCDSPQRARASSFTRFLDHTQRRTTVGRTPLDEWSARHRDLYFTTDNTHNRQTAMPPVGFEPTNLAGERPQTYALDLAANVTGINIHITRVFLICWKWRQYIHPKLW